MKKETCPFCGYRWISKSTTSPIIECPNCHQQYHERPRVIDTRVEKNF